MTLDRNKKRTTIYDLATVVGASPSAVSSVLNGTWEKRRIGKKLAQRIMRIAEEQGYAVNTQASLLRRDKSNIIGMIVPKYDNRYFGAIAEKFETMARKRGMFPVVTCTQRDPELEFEAARELVSFQTECLISTGATDPDRISKFCAASGVQSINIDLPGSEAPSIISDNFSGAFDLTNLILDCCERMLHGGSPLRFIGGRLTDHNTATRIKGFVAAHEKRGLHVPDSNILATGYSATSATKILNGFVPDGPTGIFVNSTISLEGVVRWHGNLEHREKTLFGSFDWDPFGQFLPGNVGMIEQDIDGMLSKAFDLVGAEGVGSEPILIPCRLHSFV